MGKSLAEISEKDINKVFELSNIKRKNSESSFYRVTQRYSESSKNLEPEGVLLEEGYGDRLKINKEGIFFNHDYQGWREISCAKAIIYLVKQDYDFFP